MYLRVRDSWLIWHDSMTHLTCLHEWEMTRYEQGNHDPWLIKGPMTHLTWSHDAFDNILWLIWHGFMSGKSLNMNKGLWLMTHQMTHDSSWLMTHLTWFHGCVWPMIRLTWCEWIGDRLDSEGTNCHESSRCYEKSLVNSQQCVVMWCTFICAMTWLRCRGDGLDGARTFCHESSRCMKRF